MTDTDIILRDNLALAELDPDSDSYRQMRLAQTLAKFKAGKRDMRGGCGVSDLEGLQELQKSDSGLHPRRRLSSDDFDLIETMREAEAKAEDESEEADYFTDEIRDGAEKYRD